MPKPNEASSRDAKLMFNAYGGAFTDDADQLKEQYLALAKTNHPDAGGSDRAMADINVAYSALRNEVRQSAPVRVDVVDHFTSVDQFCQRVKELSGPEARRMRVWAFDGETGFFNITVEAVPELYDFIAKGMVMLAQASDRRMYARAVLISPPDSQQLFCIYANGEPVEPVAFRLLGFSMNPGADKRFVMQLKEYLR